MTIRPAVWLATAALALPACATAPALALEARLTHLHWTLQSATDGQGQPITALFPRAEPRFMLAFQNGQVGIRGGCNAMGANYQIDAAQRLQVGPIAGTRKACAGGLMEADTALSALLTQGLQLRLEDGTVPLLRMSAAGLALVWVGAPAP